jgi:hypothetical protein
VQFDLDHFFICVARGGPEAGGLREFGLVEGSPNQHPGQGTANRRFFFHNAFLELLWVVDQAEAQSPLVERTRLWDRWSRRGQGASPIGICFRSARAHGTEQTHKPPFATWQYRPPYLPAPLAIEMGVNSQLSGEPLLFFTSFGRRADGDEPARRQPIEHPAGMRLITRLQVAGPPHELASAELRAAELECPSLSIAWGCDELVEVGFDGETVGKSHDFRPELPLVLHW